MYIIQSASTPSPQGSLTFIDADRAVRATMRSARDWIVVENHRLVQRVSEHKKSPK